MVKYEAIERTGDGTLLSRVVMVVGHDLSDQLFISRAIADLGSEVRLVTFETGGDAIDYVLCRGPYQWREASEDPCLLITNHELPDMLAIDLARSVRAMKRGESLPIFVYAALLDSEMSQYGDHGVPAPFIRNDQVERFQSALQAAVKAHLGD